MNKNNLIDFAKEQCEIFPEDSEMGMYLRETLKLLQAESCEDSISRQAVLEVVENSCLDLGSYEDTEAFCYTIKSLPPVKPVACIAKVNFSKEDMQEIVDKKVEEITVEPRWIPVSERLPEEDGFYLATCDGEICGENEPFTGLAEYENGKWVDDEEDYQCVLAWMPLPEPYKAESEE